MGGCGEEIEGVRVLRVKSLMHCWPQVAEFLRERGNEYGTTTSRPRRIGWIDIMQVMK